MDAAQAAQFSHSELTRYSRHLLLPEVGILGQQKLKNAKVLVVGAGGLGCPTSLYLAAAGVGHLGLVDFDPIDLSNLQRQILYKTKDVGKSKVATAAARIRELNDEIRVQVFDEKLSARNARSIVEQFDIVIDGTDNFSTRYLINDACVLTGKPNVYGSIYRFEGQLSLFHPPAGPCYRCLFPEAPPPEAVPNCAEGGVLGVLAGTIGVLQATEALKWILGIGGSGLLGSLLLYDAIDVRFDKLKIRRNQDCAICGKDPTITELVDTVVTCAIELEPEVGEEPTEISVQSLQKLLTEDPGKVRLLDVRTSEEFVLCQLPDAQLIPIDELESRIKELDTAQEIVVYCKSGVRSRKAAQLLRLKGFKKVRHLTGGIVRWAREIDKSIIVY